MSRLDRNVCLILQVLVLGVPLLLGGRHPWTLPLAYPTVLALLAVTARERRRRGETDAVPGVAALAAFVTLGMVTTVPLPPGVLGVFAPAAARLFGTMLPGWPSSGAWTAWRALAIDPYGVWLELGRLAVSFAVFAVVVAYPWRAQDVGEAPGERVFTRLVLTLIAGGAALSALALVQEVAGNDRVLWISGAPRQSGRASGAFVNPNHFAAWLEMVIPVALAYCVALTGRLRRRLDGAASAGRGMGVRPRRAWIAALIANQRRLWPPLLAATAVVVMVVAHLASGSRGGMAALLAGLAVTAAGMAASAQGRHTHGTVRRWVPVALAVSLVAVSATALTLWAATEADDQAADASDVIDVSFASRVAVAAQGRGIVRDHPLFGTGLGSWLHAYRPYQAPPVEGGIWDHAHNDYLELAAETGIAGVAVALLFVIAVARALRRFSGAGEGDEERARRRHRDFAGDRPPGFEVPEWRAAFAERAFLRWGLAGGVAAILVHSFVEFGLRMPANLMTLMVVVALLLLSGRPKRSIGTEMETVATMQLAGPPASPRRVPAVALLLAALIATALPGVANTALILAGARPLSPRDCLDEADVTLAEGGEEVRGQAIALVHRALDRSPADREAHEALATALGPGAEGDDALRRALVLEPWSPQVRDQLALRLWARGQWEAGAVELEESMFRFPYLVSHAYLSADGRFAPRDTRQLLRALADGDTMVVRLAALEPEMAGAIERGLGRALDVTIASEQRAGIVNDLVTLLEVRERWAEAAAVLRAEADRGLDGGIYLARAARDYLQALDSRAAERTLLAALLRTPEQGDLYRELAVDVYVARGDFDTAATVLKAGERNALDVLPVYRGVVQMLARREAARSESFDGPISLRQTAADEEVAE